MEWLSSPQNWLFKDSRYSPNKMSRKTFRAFLNETFDFTDDIIMDRLFKHFNKISCDDIDAEEWVAGFSIFLKGSKIKSKLLTLIFLCYSKDLRRS